MCASGNQAYTPVENTSFTQQLREVPDIQKHWYLCAHCHKYMLCTQLWVLPLFHIIHMYTYCKTAKDSWRFNFVVSSDPRN